jgi:outer membrane receptor protein involved in Fe transport
VAIAGKQVPLVPDWLEKFIASTNYGGFEAQVSGDYVGRRFTTYLNDLSVAPTFVVGLEASYEFDRAPNGVFKKLKLSGNITNLTNNRAAFPPPASPAPRAVEQCPGFPFLAQPPQQARRSRTCPK